MVKEPRISKLFLNELEGFSLVSVSIPNETGIKSKLIPELCDTTWWLSDSPELNNGIVSVMYAHQGNTVFVTDRCHAIRGVRPLIHFKFAKGSVKKGDKLMIDKWLFDVIAPGQAICETVIGYSPYAYPRKQAPSRFIDSAVFNFLEIWLTLISNCACFKISENNFTDDIITKVTMLSVKEATANHPAVMANGFPCWLKTRKDEFTGYYLDEQGLLSTADISSKLYLAPVVYLDTELSAFDRFSINGRIFVCLNAKNGFCICLNPLRPTCYSTGIAEIGDEEAFFYESEAFEELRQWKVLNNI